MDWHPALERPWAREIVDTTQGPVLKVTSAQRRVVFALRLPSIDVDQATVVRLADNFIKAINEKAPGA